MMHHILVWFGTRYQPRGNVKHMRVYTYWHNADNYAAWVLERQGASVNVAFRHKGTGTLQADRFDWLGRQ